MMIYVLVAGGLVVLVWVIACQFTTATRSARRQRKGPIATATVIDVAPMERRANGGIGQPYTIRFHDIYGGEHMIRCPDGFGGAVPEKGATVKVRYDPRAPQTLSVLDTPRPPRTRISVLRMGGPVLVVGMFGGALLLPTAWLAGVSAAAFQSAGQLYTCALMFLFGASAVIVTLCQLVSDFAWPVWTARTRATVTDVWTHWRRYYDGHDKPLGLMHSFVVAFELPDGRRFHTLAPEASAFFRPRQGQEVTIRYDEKRPTRFHVAEVLPMLFLKHVTHIAIAAGFVVMGLDLASEVDTAPLAVFMD